MIEKIEHQWETTSTGEFHEVRECKVCHLIVQMNWWPDTDQRVWSEVWKVDKTAPCFEEEA